MQKQDLLESKMLTLLQLSWGIKANFFHLLHGFSKNFSFIIKRNKKV